MKTHNDKSTDQTVDLEAIDVAAEGYRTLRRLSDGTLIGTRAMMYTTGLFVGLDRHGYRTRFCYEREADAMTACLTWDGTGDPPGLWIKEKPADRLNPAWVVTRPANTQERQ